MAEIFRVLRPGGHAVVMEWNPDAQGSVGPETSLRVPKEDLRRLVGDAGFSRFADVPVGSFHYAFLLTK
jgi:ubiquinone/menaquinone biosynthesis C-methylase UbiE